jgi:hypothetical protein
MLSELAERQGVEEAINTPERSSLGRGWESQVKRRGRPPKQQERAEGRLTRAEFQ